MEIDIDSKLVWIPKTVIFEGKEYPAPLNLLPLMAHRVLIELLEERQNKRKCYEKSI